MQRFPIASNAAPNQRFEQLMQSQNPAYQQPQPQQIMAQNQMLNRVPSHNNSNYTAPTVPANSSSNKFPPTAAASQSFFASSSNTNNNNYNNNNYNNNNPNNNNYNPAVNNNNNNNPAVNNYTPAWNSGQSLLPQKFVPSAQDLKPRMPERIYFTFKFMHDRLGTLVKAGALCMCSDAETCELALVDYIVHDLAQVMREHPKGLAYANEQYKMRIAQRRQLTQEEQDDFAVTGKHLIKDEMIYTQYQPDLPDVVVVKDLDVDYRKDMWMCDFQGPTELDYSEQLGKAFLSPVNAPTMYHVMLKNMDDKHNDRDTFSPVFTYMIDYTEQFVKESVKNPSRYDDVFQS